MDEYTLSVDETASAELRVDNIEAEYREHTESEITSAMIGTKKMEEKTDLEKAVRRETRLERYGLGTAIDIVEQELAPLESIAEKITIILDLLQSLGDNLGDLQELELIFSNIMEYHKTLWTLRKYREIAYAEVLVLIESCIKYYNVAEFTDEKIEVLKQIYGKLRCASLISEYPRECREKLLSVGFDIFRPFEGLANKYILELKGEE